MTITNANNLRPTNYSITNFTDANRLGEDVTFNIEQLRALGLGNSDSTGIQTAVNNTVYKTTQEALGVRYDFKNISNQIKTIATFESSETYTGASATVVAANTTAGQFLMGTQSIKLTNATPGNSRLQAYRDVSFNLSLFGDGSTVSYDADVIEFNIYINDTSFFQNDSGTGAIYIWFYTSAADRFASGAGRRARYRIPLANLVNGWNQFRVVKNSSFTYLNGFTNSDWASLAGIYLFGNTSSASAEASFDNFYLKRYTSGLSDRIAYSGTSNSDVSSGSTLTVTDGRRLNDLLLTSPYRTFLTMLDSQTSGYGLSYEITGFSNNQITVSGTLPTKTNNVLWVIERPRFIMQVEKSTMGYEETASVFKLATVTSAVESTKIILINNFKPVNANRQFWLKGSFQFRTNSANQGFCLFYVDSSNYLLAYIDNAGASSTVKIDQVLAGVTTNIYTSGTFTISANDDLSLFVRVKGDQIEVYRSSVNTPNLTLVTRQLYYNAAFIDYYYQLGFYASLELRLLEFSAGEDYDFLDNKLYSVNSGTFATASTLTITDVNIHKNSMLTYQLRSAPVGNIYISAVNEGSVTFTGSSASETAQIQIQIYN